jgi:hypothetical protein
MLALTLRCTRAVLVCAYLVRRSSVYLPNARRVGLGIGVVVECCRHSDANKCRISHLLSKVFFFFFNFRFCFGKAWQVLMEAVKFI